MSMEINTNTNNTNNEPISKETYAKYKKLSNGTWAISIPVSYIESKGYSQLPYGFYIYIKKANGDITEERIDKYHSTVNYYVKDEDGYKIIENGKFKTEKHHIYTIVKKYKKGGYSPKEQTELSNNKPKSYSNKSKNKHNQEKYKTSNSGGGYITQEHDYDVYVWEYNLEEKKYKLIVETPNMPYNVTKAIVEKYKAKQEMIVGVGYRYQVVGQKENHKGVYNYTTNGDFIEGSENIADSLFASLINEKEALENLDKTWIMCNMGCNSFPARGQKIKGILGLSDYIKGMVDYKKIHNAVVVSENHDVLGIHHKHYNVNKRFEFEDIWPSVVGKFMRPVPKVPKHGFVDSRKVNTKEDVEKVIEEIRATGEEPEFIALPFIDCSYSSVITPDNIALGKGHDGATQGDGAYVLSLEVGDEQREQLNGLFWDVKEKYCPNCLKTYPYNHYMSWTSKDECDECDEVLLNKWPYVEVLYEDNLTMPTVVQLRSGPEMKIESERVKVKKVVKINSSMDLLEWDKLAHALKQEIENSPNGSYSRIVPVVWHPGGAYTSHFGVHCKDNKIPYLTSLENPCKEGDVIEVGVKSEMDLESLRQGLVLGFETKLEGLELDGRRKAKRFLKNFISTLHAYSLFDLGNSEVARFVGYSFAVGSRIIAGLPMGEARHLREAREMIENVIGEEFEGVTCANNKMKHKMCSCGSCRGYIYTTAWKLGIEKLIEGSLAAYNGFLLKDWSSSFGGKAWAECTKSLLDVFIAMREFLREPSKENGSEIVDKVNVMVNLAHNTGWFLNKLVEKSDFDKAHKLPHFSISPEIAFRLREEMEKVGKYALKVKAFQIAKTLDIKKQMEAGVLIDKEYTKDKPKINQDEVLIFKSPNFKSDMFSGQLTQEEIKTLIIPDSGIYIQYHYKDHFHYQVKSFNINRPYGYSGSIYEIKGGVEVEKAAKGMYLDGNLNGDNVNSLTGSSTQYRVTKVFLAKNDKPVVEFTYNGKTVYGLIEDQHLYKHIGAIREWQINEGMVKVENPADIKKTPLEKYKEYLKDNDLEKYWIAVSSYGYKEIPPISYIMEKFPHSKPADVAKGLVKDVMNIAILQALGNKASILDVCAKYISVEGKGTFYCSLPENHNSKCMGFNGQKLVAVEE